MTAKELKEYLSNYPDDSLVEISNDRESCIGDSWVIKDIIAYNSFSDKLMKIILTTD